MYAHISTINLVNGIKYEGCEVEVEVEVEFGGLRTGERLGMEQEMGTLGFWLHRNCLLLPIEINTNVSNPNHLSLVPLL